jgi:molybdopterin/thiamine biosynthesis adenylyltransferase
MNDIYLRQENLNLDTDKRIVIIGCGGIGFNLAQYFSMAGIENLYLFDNDVIEIHNLARLAIPYTCIGKNKATLLRDLIKQMRPDCNVIGYPFKFNPLC